MTNNDIIKELKKEPSRITSPFYWLKLLLYAA